MPEPLRHRAYARALRRIRDPIRADGLPAVGALEDEAPRGEAVEVRGLEKIVSVAGEGVGALFVGPEQQEVGVAGQRAPFKEALG